MEDKLYWYKAKIVSVYDADTITASIGAGFGIEIKEMKIRLSRINAPEVRGPQRPEGIVSRDWLRLQLLDQEVIINTEKDKKGKWGRYLGEVYLNGENINDKLVELGFAEYKSY